MRISNTSTTLPTPNIRVICGALLVDHCVVLREAFDDLVEKVTPLVADQLDGTPETAPDVFL